MSTLKMIEGIDSDSSDYQEIMANEDILQVFWMQMWILRPEIELK